MFCGRRGRTNRAKVITMRTWLAAALVTLCLAPAAQAATPVTIPRGNGTWAYDATRIGQWADDIAGYDATATDGHAITTVMSYATDLEMSCPGNDPARCTPRDFHVRYSANGRQRSTAAYAQRVPGVVMEPIVDGAIGTLYLPGFNDLSPDLAAAFADRVAARVCADPNVAGIQFDLEPVNVRTMNGQYWFYTEIAKAFAGRGCIDASHPSGRFFSIFTFADRLRPGSASAKHLAAIVNGYSNGYVIDSLYDLGTRDGGWLNTPDEYESLVEQQVDQMRDWSDQLGIQYGFGVPGGASAHEYTTCTGSLCHHDPGSRAGYPMLQYTTRAIDAIDTSGARDDSLFVGNYLWYFGVGPQFHPGYTVTPAPVPPAVLNFVADRL